MGIMNDDAIWEYNSPSGILTMKIYNRGDGILANYPIGNINGQDARILLDFLIEYKNNNPGDLYLAIDNSRIKSVSTHARNFVVNQMKENSPLKKAASFGNNLMMRNFMNIFSAIMAHSGIHHHAFRSEKEAIEWLKQ